MAPRTSPTWSAAWTARASRSPTCSSTPPASTTSSWPRPAARSKAQGTSRRPRWTPVSTPRSRDRRRGDLRGEREHHGLSPNAGAPPSLALCDPHDAAADRDRAATDLSAVPARDQCLGAERRDEHPGLPDELLPGVRPRLPVHAGRDLRDEHSGDEHRPGHRERILQPPLLDPDERLLAARGPTHRRLVDRHAP